MYTSELFKEIKGKITLSAEAEHELKKILKCLDDKTITNDLYDEEDEEEEW